MRPARGRGDGTTPAARPRTRRPRARRRRRARSAPSPTLLRVRAAASRCSSVLLRLDESMARAGVEIEPVDALEIADAAQRRLGERCLAVERMQHDPLEKITERDVV